MKRAINPPALPKPFGYQQAVAASGSFVFISGQVSVDAEGKVLWAGELQRQTAQALRNLEHALRAAGAEVEDVVKVMYYLATPDIADLGQFEAGFALAAEWGVRLPVSAASTLLRVAGLGSAEWMVEIDAIACIEGPVDRAPLA